MKSLFISPEAQEDLQEIHDYIADDDPEAALAFIAKLEKRINSLAINPGIGRRRDEIAQDLRSITEGKYLILYTCTAELIEIVRVLHGARNIRKVFHPEA